MKKKFLFSFVLLGWSLCQAQVIPDSAAKVILRNYTISYGIPSLKVIDQYLSPVEYSGVGALVESNYGRYLSSTEKNVSIENNQRILVGYLSNPSFSNQMIYPSANINWGYYYHYRPMENLKIMVGGLWNYDLALKYDLKNTNNVFNLDFSTDIDLAVKAIYNLPLWNREFKIKLAFQTPLFGTMFVPASGITYYELLTINNNFNPMCFSTPFNKQGYKIKLSIDVPLKHATWTIGFTTEKILYTANDMIFKNEMSGLVIGATFDFMKFAGRVNAPSNSLNNINK
jgi:Protein of unknown function (DUF3316)